MNQGQTITEIELVKQLRDKKDSAFAYLYDQYSGALYGVICRNIGNREQANDLLQEVFIRVFRNIDQYNPEKGRLYTWLMNLTRNLTIDHLRSKANKDSSQNQNIENSVNTINQHYFAETETNSIGLKKIVGQLPENQAELLDLVYFRGFTQQEASETLGLPLGTVKTRVRMGIGTLKKIFKSD